MKNQIALYTGEEIKILSTKQILQRFPVLLAQVNITCTSTGNNSEDSRNEFHQVIYSINKLKQISKYYRKIVFYQDNCNLIQSI